MGFEPDTLRPQPVEDQREPMHDSPPASDMGKDAAMLSLEGFFGVKNPSVEESDNMRFIISYFEKHGMNEMPLILMNLKNIQSRLGAGELVMSRLQALKNYLKIQQNIEFNIRQKNSMEHA